MIQSNFMHDCFLPIIYVVKAICEMPLADILDKVTVMTWWWSHAPKEYCMHDTRTSLSLAIEQACCTRHNGQKQVEVRKEAPKHAGVNLQLCNCALRMNSNKFAGWQKHASWVSFHTR